MIKSFRLTLYLAVVVFLSSCNSQQALSTDERSAITKQDVRHAQNLLGLEFESHRIDTLRTYLDRNLRGYDSIRSYSLPYETFPAIIFDHHPIGYQLPDIQDALRLDLEEDFQRPEDDGDLAHSTITQLASLIQSQQITSTALTQLYIDRLKKYNPTLQCAITITEDLALAQAKRADEEIARGEYKGLLHGIPYGTKDLMAVEGYVTTWGATPYREQIIDHTATVIKKLEEAGAVLIAKLTSGALARGDVWFDGKTKNPWDTLQGASGSSAGPGSATAAGLVGFSLGTETLGSITSPSNRNGISGLRPTYGRVSRDGVMSLSWSMDKVGPMCRSAEDCAIVFDAIRGKDPLDNTTQDVGFAYESNGDISKLKIAYLENDIEKDTSKSKPNLIKALGVLDAMGIVRTPIALPTDYPFDGFDIILRAEAGAMFDDLVRSGKVDLMVQQSKKSRANSLRQARFIPAVEYIQANRYRRLLIEEVNKLFEAYDVIIAPTFGGRQLLITNLTGHPVVTVPTGLDEEGHPTSMTFIGNLYQEGAILAFANAYQKVTQHDEMKPPLFD
jgi:Asp-tRNA(Asn)/Glu-tRNA(Gln) amidotransferase A subunit family amidase